jgi:hypothetical protein
MIPGALTNGIESLKAQTPERISLKPVNQAEKYSPSGINKITFRLPAYSNSFLDTSKSFFTYTLGYTTATANVSINKDHCCSPINNACFIDRLARVKTSAGLVLDDIGDYGILTAINSQMLPMGNHLNDIEGRNPASMDSGVHSGDYSIRRNFKDTGIQYRHQIQAGVLSKFVQKLLDCGLLGH